MLYLEAWVISLSDEMEDWSSLRFLNEICSSAIFSQEIWTLTWFYPTFLCSCSNVFVLWMIFSDPCEVVWILYLQICFSFLI